MRRGGAAGLRPAAGFLDSAGARHPGTRMLNCEMTLRKGEVVWDLNGRAGQDWKTFPYRKEPWIQ